MFLEKLNIKPEEAGKIRDLDIKTLQSAIQIMFLIIFQDIQVYFGQVLFMMIYFQKIVMPLLEMV